ncbi:MAG TPA: hypothetical protein VK835_12710 [Bacteroidia bacterium]|jgi:hypothetical protein|nr:hypothetical protein [Bacteroidia bacterium]
MQRDFVIQQLKEEAKKVEKYILQLEQDEALTQAETEQFLSDVEKLYRNLSVYAHVLKTQGNLQVHLKIMQSVPPAEEPVVIEKTAEPTPELNFEEKTEEKTPEIAPVLTEENLSLKKIEFSINDRFRVINELFAQSQPEFQAALQQLNSINTLDESLFYLNSLKPIYNWKDDNQLVKTLYNLVNKRFS